MPSRFSRLGVRRTAPLATAALASPQAIIDIGSNSIRLVIWKSGGRAPAVMFNEKVMAGLGRGLETGCLDDGAMAAAEMALARFAELARRIGADEIRAVATAAVREAENGPAFVKRIHEKTGLIVEVLTGEEEAAASAYGVIAAIPDADGIIGDLGGGSLELVRISGGEVHDRISLPLGSLRVDEIRARGAHALERVLARALKSEKWLHKAAGKPFYAVGGSWRALAQVHMALIDHPLPAVHEYRLDPPATTHLVRALVQMTPKTLKLIPNLSTSRIPTLSGAAALLSATVRYLESSHVTISGWGLREGLLYQDLPRDIQLTDPLIEAARLEGDLEGRFSGQGDALHAWISPLFEGEDMHFARLRHAACLLADVAWRAHPDFRPDRGLEFALHGNWVGIDGFGRALLGAALFANFGGPPGHWSTDVLESLADQASLARARNWGLAMRLGLRMTGGLAHDLADVGLAREGADLVMRVPMAKRALYGESISRRHKALAAAMALDARLEII